MSDYVRKRLWTRSRRRVAIETHQVDEDTNLILRIPSTLQRHRLDREKLKLLEQLLPKLPESAFETHNVGGSVRIWHLKYF
jgi:hypothetical protein